MPVKTVLLFQDKQEHLFSELQLSTLINYKYYQQYVHKYITEYVLNSNPTTNPFFLCKSYKSFAGISVKFSSIVTKWIGSCLSKDHLADDPLVSKTVDLSSFQSD